MIKASLDLHDPIDIYDQLKSEFGNLSMLIKQNAAILTFQNIAAIRAILQNPKRFIKGYPLTLKAFQDTQEEKKAQKKINSLGQSFTNSMDLEDPTLQFQNSPINEFLQFNSVQENFKAMTTLYHSKLKEIKEKFSDADQCNKKITDLNNKIIFQIKRNRYFKKPFLPLISLIRKFSLQTQLINIDNVFSKPVVRNQEQKGSTSNLSSSPCFQEMIINYSSPDIGSVKRLCMLNDENFITTLKLNEKGQDKGQLRIFRKEKQTAQFTLDIEEGPYSLMMHQNFILAGDFKGHIHMIDIQNQNLCEYSNKLSYGLLVHMKKFESKMKTPSILTLVTGERLDYKIKLFQVQRQKINNQIDSLFFHPKEQILCQGITMALEVLNDGKFAYGCGRNTYVCPSFNKYERQYVTHDQNVMMLKMKNHQELIEATQRKILSLDLRACRLKNTIFEFSHDINNFQLLSDNYIFYGGKMGQVGVIDSRKPNAHVWNPPQIMHCGKISDILKMGDDVISGDSTGNIFGWKSRNFR